jgi:hypothetical protein
MTVAGFELWYVVVPSALCCYRCVVCLKNQQDVAIVATRAVNVPCERGNHGSAWGVGLFYGPLWVCVLGCVVAMVMLYLKVRKINRRSMRYSTAMGMNHDLSKSGTELILTGSHTGYFVLSLFWYHMAALNQHVVYWNMVQVDPLCT